MDRFAKMMTHIFAIIILFSLCLHSTAQQPGVTTTEAPAFLNHPCTYNQSNPQGNCDKNAECRAPPNDICVCAHGFYNSTKTPPCRRKVGEPCHGADECIDSAVCGQPPTATTTATPTTTTLNPPLQPDICQCSRDFYPTEDGLCAPRKKLNDECQPLENGHSPCVQPTVTMCHDRRCVCNDYYYQNDTQTCTPRKPAGAACTTGSPDECVPGANCQNGHCNCTSTFFINDFGHCQERISPGQNCVLVASGENTCTEGAACSEGVCRCNPYIYKETANACTSIKHIGDPCSDTNECPLNAHCATFNTTSSQTSQVKLCACLDDYIYNVATHSCQQRKPAGSSCHSTEECVANAACINRICVCDLHYYNHNQRCNHRVRLDFPCDPLIPDQCLLNGECVHGSCKCNNRSYNNEAANCPLTLPFGEPCNWANSNPRQCVSNTSCIFRKEDSLPVCGCDINHFFDGNYCIRRAMAGDSCPYDNSRSLGHNVTNQELERQCVENAECKREFELCTCKENHYNRNGRCPTRIAVGQPCDPWTDYDNQCVDGSVCLYGQCVQSDANIGQSIG